VALVPAIIPEANPQTRARMRDIHTFEGIPEAHEGSRPLKGAGTWSEVGRTRFGPNTSPSLGEGSSGRLGVAHYGILPADVYKDLHAEGGKAGGSWARA